MKLISGMACAFALAAALTACNEEGAKSGDGQAKGSAPKAEAAKVATFKDARNGHEYKYVKIGELDWMAENLNFEVANGSWCKENKAENCDKLGRFYSWEAAQTVCPEGWRLPSKTDFEALVKLAGGVQSADLPYIWEKGGDALKSTSGWQEDRNGTDALGFNGIPTGYYHGGFEEFQDNSMAGFWSSTEAEALSAYYLTFEYSHRNAWVSDFGKLNGFSVRCVK